MKLKEGVPVISTEKISSMFKNFTDKFKTDGKLHPMLAMKYKHSYRVADISVGIADALGWDESGDTETAYAIGLFHDAGRFPQYRDYETFNDAESFDHGDESAKITEAEFRDSGITDKELKLITVAVKHHNKKELTDNLSIVQYRWGAMIRDADKIDIFRMVQNKIESGQVKEMLPRHSLEDGLSPALVEEVRKKGNGSFANASSLADFRLIQLTWGCDLNYAPSFKLLESEGIFRKIADDLRPFGIDDIVDPIMQRISSM